MLGAVDLVFFIPEVILLPLALRNTHAPMPHGERSGFQS
jgi:hypothetical protein